MRVDAARPLLRAGERAKEHDHPAQAAVAPEFGEVDAIVEGGAVRPQNRPGIAREPVMLIHAASDEHARAGEALWEAGDPFEDGFTSFEASPRFNQDAVLGDRVLKQAAALGRIRFVPRRDVGGDHIGHRCHGCTPGLWSC